jgi:hypothetical protein
MTTRRLYRVAFGGLALAACAAPLAALFFAPRDAESSGELMFRLPTYARYQCVLCHTSSNPVAGSADLNPFGADFLANGSVWDKTLAYLNSDGDKCLNGFELGDQNGDGVFDYAGQPVEHSNPGDGNDCSIALTQKTWGRIKEVFRSEMPDFMNGADLHAPDVHFGDRPVHFP